MDFSSAESKIAVFQFIELLMVISILCISFVIILLRKRQFLTSYASIFQVPSS